MIKTLVKWLLIITLLAAAFVYFDGAGFLQDFGKKSVEVGEKIEEAEKRAREMSENVSKEAKKKLKKLKEETEE